jgi:hypothetical protein
MLNFLTPKIDNEDIVDAGQCEMGATLTPINVRVLSFVEYEVFKDMQLLLMVTIF